MSNPINYTESYFTFGADHMLPNGKPARDEYVIVSVPQGEDPREVFIGWLGSNKFASEYNANEWTFQGIRDQFYQGRSPAYVINVIERAGNGY